MKQETQMFCGDSAVELLKIKDNSVDMLCSDPPYGYSFMNKGWDKVLPNTEIWRQSYRVLKPGAFITIMAAPRTDVLWRISRDLEEAGFDLSFTNIEWVYHSGFPKATDISKSLDKRLGGEREVVDKVVQPYTNGKPNVLGGGKGMGEHIEYDENGYKIYTITAPSTDVAKKYEGSKAGFQPKPAREIIIVGMKPFSEGSYVDKVLNFEALPDNIKMTYPLIQTPKPAKKEKDFGLTCEEKPATNQYKNSKVSYQANGTATLLLFCLLIPSLFLLNAPLSPSSTKGILQSLNHDTALLYFI